MSRTAVAKRLRPSTLWQQDISLMTGVRQDPINPIHRASGAVLIGNRAPIVVKPRYWTKEELEQRDLEQRIEWNAAKWRGTSHEAECVQMQMGEYCTHPRD
jgi:hypothetical protein